MNRIILANLVFFVGAVSTAQAGDFVVGGKLAGPRDPVTDSTVGVFSPNPDGTGALCTGTLIKDDIALTAAHCISKGAKPELIFNRDLRAPGAARREAEGVAVNPKWRQRGGRGMDQGDIALVKFDGRLPEGYKPVPSVSSDAALRPGEKVTLAGYGISDAGRKLGAGRLRKTQVSVLDGRPGKSEMILDQSHGHGACHGDSGGPAFIRSGGHIALAGLTNRSYPDSAPDDCAHDVVYTKVPAYKNWIQRNEKKLETRPPAARARARHARRQAFTGRSHFPHRMAQMHLRLPRR